MHATITTCCLSIALLLSATLYSQPDSLNIAESASADTLSKKIFVRLYNEHGRRIGDGYLLFGNDSMIMLSKNNTVHKYPVSRVSFIKTKHQAIRGVAIGTGIGIGLFAIGWAIADKQDKQTAEGRLLGDGFDTRMASFLFPPAGALAGSVAGMTTKRRTILINGNKENWKAARKEIFHR